MFAVIHFVRDRRGATAIEYGLIAALIAMGIIGGLNSFASNAIGIMNTVSDTVRTTM